MMTSVMNQTTITVMGASLAPPGAAWEVEHVDLAANEVYCFRVRGADAADAEARATGPQGVVAVLRYPPTKRSAPLRAPALLGAGCTGCGAAVDRSQRCLDCLRVGSA